MPACGMLVWSERASTIDMLEQHCLLACVHTSCQQLNAEMEGTGPGPTGQATSPSPAGWKGPGEPSAANCAGDISACMPNIIIHSFSVLTTTIHILGTTYCCQHNVHRIASCIYCFFRYSCNLCYAWHDIHFVWRIEAVVW